MRAASRTSGSRSESCQSCSSRLCSSPPSSSWLATTAAAVSPPDGGGRGSAAVAVASITGRSLPPRQVRPPADLARGRCDNGQSYGRLLPATGRAREGGRPRLLVTSGPPTNHAARVTSEKMVAGAGTVMSSSRPAAASVAGRLGWVGAGPSRGCQSHRAAAQASAPPTFHRWYQPAGKGEARIVRGPPDAAWAAAMVKAVAANTPLSLLCHPRASTPAMTATFTSTA